MEDKLPSGGYGGRAKAAADMATDAERRATDAKNTVLDILDAVPKHNCTVKEMVDNKYSVQEAVYKTESYSKVLSQLLDTTYLLFFKKKRRKDR